MHPKNEDSISFSSTKIMTYVEQRNEIIKQYREGRAIKAYVVIGDSDYLTVKDIVTDREFIISRYEIED